MGGIPLSLSELWFLLIAVLFVGFFFLEGFDFGVGMSSGIIAKTDRERRTLINSIGPFWDGNEVWLITAGGAMFAAFPHWYATLFSGFYLPLVVVLLALIGRGVAFEFRSKVKQQQWRKTWDIIIVVSSALLPFLFGVVFATLMKGLPIDGEMQLRAGFLDIVNPYTVVGGLSVTLLCLVHGLLFVSLRTVGDLRERALHTARQLMLPLAAMLVIYAVMTYLMTDIFTVRGWALWIMVILGAGALALANYFVRQKREGWAFGMTGAVIAISFASVFIGLFPRVMISSLGSAFDLTVYNASSGGYSLKVMTIVACTLLPFVLGYQIWSYYVFRKRLNEQHHLEY
ncbi:cytochrome d ubiquinol oxidase subunit 2 [Paenibacillus sp. Root52]|uniref:cytochrome d ubiquinol oxidase subunit II n=1 Tax=Paenibacillus sp. Root52 TaxID=1736552 RepID=UPI0006F64053|nr:cytochrome d ubiquinol oxidase subunit II [Paenibacillus sp. Root52]KQY82096.1 cytochrome d ubiquinol oxidase subunit 2 [Paenibacillus sp. Root52]